ncbi:hypothetical protein EYF80_056999 [Liparis tanakae]|uniref:Uncharacterized protein n=1 Tax=Liparis tanakae TaxID=230148 RepID=A0A4Z2EVC1_9TELE|nr:hypothetical protein EYF80_056999 [Liparis tanakae]
MEERGGERGREGERGGEEEEERRRTMEESGGEQWGASSNHDLKAPPSKHQSSTLNLSQNN